MKDMLVYVQCDGRKGSSKNPAAMTIVLSLRNKLGSYSRYYADVLYSNELKEWYFSRIHLDCGETVSLDVLYKKGEGWLPAEDASARAVYLYCVYVTHDRCWTDVLLQNFINAHYVIKTSWNREASTLRWMECYSQWRYSLNENDEVITWNNAN